jgi:hypothetical protein
LSCCDPSFTKKIVMKGLDQRQVKFRVLSVRVYQRPYLQGIPRFLQIPTFRQQSSDFYCSIGRDIEIVVVEDYVHTVVFQLDLLFVVCDERVGDFSQGEQVRVYPAGDGGREPLFCIGLAKCPLSGKRLLMHVYLFYELFVIEDDDTSVL